MRVRMSLLVWIHLVVAAFGQNYYPRKDAAFGQVAVGGEIETVINLTNRGTFAYTGTVRFFRGKGNAWNPLVNGNTISNGTYPLEIQPKSTATLRITWNQLESGAAVVISEDLLLDNFIEANLTYFVRSGASVADSVGVFPSKEFYLASVPFQDLNTVALALVNGDLSGERVARVLLRLFTEGGSQLAAKTLELGSLFHDARFLSELFPGLNLERGKVEISSDIPIFGTALTLKEGELSSLPLEPSPVSYAVRMLSSEGAEATGEMALWAEGFFVKGYFLISAVDGEPLEEAVLELVNGQLFDRFLQLSFAVAEDPFFAEEATLYFEHTNFSFDSDIVSDTWVQMFLSDHETLEGTYELSRRTD